MASIFNRGLFLSKIDLRSVVFIKCVNIAKLIIVLSIVKTNEKTA